MQILGNKCAWMQNEIKTVQKKRNECRRKKKHKNLLNLPWDTTTATSSGYAATSAATTTTGAIFAFIVVHCVFVYWWKKVSYWWLQPNKKTKQTIFFLNVNVLGTNKGFLKFLQLLVLICCFFRLYYLSF